MEASRRWVTEAYCRNKDIPPELFYLPQEIDSETEELLPVDETDPRVSAQIALARSVCGRCVVRQTCLDQAVERGWVSGENVIWGGATYADRCVIRLTRGTSGEVGSVQAS